MKILQILPELNVGGVETGTVDFAKYLVAHNHPAVVVSNGGSQAGDLERFGIKHYELPVHKKNLLTAWTCVRRLRQIIKDESVDIVHARSRVPAWIAFFACRKTDAAFLTTCHGYYSPHFFSRIMGWSKLVIAPSQVIARHMTEAFHVPAKSIRIIARSVDLEKFHFQREEKKPQAPSIIAMVGRLTPLKGHGYFLKAMAKVVRMHPNVKIWVIGDAPAKKESYRRELESSAERLGLVNHIEFMGNRKDVPQLLAQSDVLVLSTVTQEAFGRVILEAQAAGATVVATRVGGVTEIIDEDETGLLVPPKDPEAMADAVLKILNDRKLSHRLTEAALKKLKTKYTLATMAEETLSVYRELLQQTNILVVKLSSLGDVILITPSLKAIRQKYPQAKIHCLVGKNFQEVLSGCPYVDQTIVFDESSGGGWPTIWNISQKLRRCHFDKIIDFQNNRKSHIIAFLSFPRESFGYKQKWGFLLTHPVSDSKEKMPPVQHQFQILKELGISLSDEAALELWPSGADAQYIQTLLDSEWMGNVQDIVGINLAASPRWETKNWPLEHIARLCEMLSSKNIRVVLTGTDKDREQVRELLKITKAKPASLVGKTRTIRELAALIARCKVFVTPDSAPLHVASAVKTPFVVLFGPTDAKRHLPPAKDFAVFQKDLPCVPCYSPTCLIATHACMKDIAPEEIFKAVYKLMGKRK